jgi:hypothetical protein
MNPRSLLSKNHPGQDQRVIDPNTHVGALAGDCRTREALAVRPDEWAVRRDQGVILVRPMRWARRPLGTGCALSDPNTPATDRSPETSWESCLATG